jgi:hypothetical protein
MFAKSVIAEEIEAFREGVELGRRYADVARRRVAAWAEEHPGQLILVALAGGFIAGKLWFRPRRKADLAGLEVE